MGQEKENETENEAETEHETDDAKLLASDADADDDDATDDDATDAADKPEEPALSPLLAAAVASHQRVWLYAGLAVIAALTIGAGVRHFRLKYAALEAKERAAQLAPSDSTATTTSAAAPSPPAPTLEEMVARARKLYASGWTLEAFETLMAQPDLTPELWAFADELMTTIVTQPMLLLDAERSVTRWLGVTKSPLRDVVVAQIAKATAAVQALPAEPQTADELVALQALVAKEPWNQLAALRLAEALYAIGNLRSALDAATGSYGAGLMIRRSRLLAAQILSGVPDDVERDDAETYLESLLEMRPAPAGALDGGAAEAALLVSRLRLLRAQPIPLGKERDDKLLAAASAILRARDLPGGGLPTPLRAPYDIVTEAKLAAYLTLTRVWLQLGYYKDAEREITALLALKQPVYELSVSQLLAEAKTYPRAKDLARAVYDRPDVSPTAKSSAAMWLSLLERESFGPMPMEWLDRAGVTQWTPPLRLQYEADELERSGDGPGCAGKLAKAAAALESLVNAQPRLAAEETLLIQQRRFRCGGELAALTEAERAMAQLLDGQSEDRELLARAIALTFHRVSIGALSKRLDVKALPLPPKQANELIRALLGEADPQEARALRESWAAAPALPRGAELIARFEHTSPNNAGAYSLRFLSALVRQDLAAAAALVERARSIKLVTFQGEERLADHFNGDLLAGPKPSPVRDQARYEKVANDARQDARTRAAAAFLLARSILTSTQQLDEDPAITARGLAAAVQAQALWPALAAERVAVDFLVEQAARRGDVARWKTFRHERTAIAALAALHELRDPLAAFVLASPEWPEALAHARAIRGLPSLDELRLARLSGDVALIERTKPALDDAMTRHWTALLAAMTPDYTLNMDNLSLYAGH